MRVVPEIARISVRGVLVGLAVVACAFIAIILLGIDAEGLAEHTVDVQVYCGGGPAAARSIRDGGPEVYSGDVLTGVIHPLHILTVGRELNIGMARCLKLRT